MSRRTTCGLQSGATYEITVVRSWSEATNPLDWPGVTAHYTGGIGATHNSAYAMFSAGGIDWLLLSLEFGPRRGAEPWLQAET